MVGGLRVWQAGALAGQLLAQAFFQISSTDVNILCIIGQACATQIKRGLWMPLTCKRDVSVTVGGLVATLDRPYYKYQSVFACNSADLPPIVTL